jgi:hypothetical protein
MLRTLLLLCLTAVLASCGLTQRVAVKSPARAGLLDYSLLKPGGEGQADLRYINPVARWTQYRKIMIDPVTFWDDDRGVPAVDQQTLCDYFYEALMQQFGEHFEIVQRPGPGTMRLHVGITDATAATPVLRSVSMLVPQARVLATLKYLATGTYPFVGGAQVEARITDSQSGQMLGEWVERHIGGGSVEAAAQWQWGDAENVDIRDGDTLKEEAHGPRNARALDPLRRPGRAGEMTKPTAGEMPLREGVAPWK